MKFHGVFICIFSFGIAGPVFAECPSSLSAEESLACLMSEGDDGDYAEAPRQHVTKPKSEQKKVVAKPAVTKKTYVAKSKKAQVTIDVMNDPFE
jgi:hypothetical protein